MVCMISNRSQRYKKIGIFLSKAVKHTRISAIFHENERDTPVSRLFFQKQVRYTRISIIFDKNKRSAPVSQPFFSKTSEIHPYLDPFQPKARERWPCYGGFNSNRCIRRAVSFVFMEKSRNRPMVSTFFHENKGKRWAYSMIFAENNTDR